MALEGLDYTNFIRAKTERFTGREWLDQEFSQFLESGRKYFVICGEPGIGKTCYAAHLVARQGYVHHFISAQDLDWRSPLVFARSVAAQLARRYGPWVLTEEAPPAAYNINIEVGTVEEGGSVVGVEIGQYVGLSIEEEFRRLVLTPLQRLSQVEQGPITLVIDGLDEAAAYSGAPAIQDLIGRLGGAPGARLLITANPGPVANGLRRLLDPSDLLRLDIDGSHPQNLADCRRFLEQAAGSPDITGRLLAAGVAPEQFIQEALDHSEGNFLYLAYLIDELVKGTAVKLDDLPAGLERVYTLILTQAAQPEDPDWLDVYMPLLGLLAVSPAPLSEADAARLSGLTFGQMRKAINSLRPLLEVDESLPLNQRTYRLYHGAFARFLLDAPRAGDYWIDAFNVHSQVAQHLLGANNLTESLQDPYALRFLAYHMRNAGPKTQRDLLAFFSPTLRRALRQRTGSDLALHLNLGEAILAAMQQPMPVKLVELARLGLVDATLGSRVASLPPQVLAELAQTGQWQRAAELARGSTQGEAAGFEAVVKGMLAVQLETPLEAALELAKQIPAGGEAAFHRARALARVGEKLGQRKDDRVGDVFQSAYQAASQAAGLDQQARCLAFAARMAAPYTEDAQAWFAQARETAAGMPVELDQDTQAVFMTANMAVQTVMEAEYNLERTPFDIRGAKVRAMADVAAEMAAAGFKEWAEQEFAQADMEAGQISGRMMDEVYRQHTLEYIAARRGSTSDEAMSPRPRAVPELEDELLASEQIPADQKGFYSRVMVAAAQALTKDGDLRAAQALELAIASLDEVEGGYKAQILLEIARLERKIGREDQAQQMESLAKNVASSDPGLLGGYTRWLAQTGREYAASLREIGMVRGLYMKSRYFSDQALANLAIALAGEDLEGASLLAGEIQDDLQRARAQAGIAAQAPEGKAQEVLDTLVKGLGHLDERQLSYVLYEAVLAAAPIKRETALVVARSIQLPDLHALALVQVARAALAAGVPADHLWREAREAARGELGPGEMLSSNLASALAALAEDIAYEEPDQAEVFWQAALRAAHAEPNQLKRVSGLAEIGASMRVSRPEAAVELLDEAARLARQLDGIRDCGKALSTIAAILFPLDEDRALEILAGLRSLGRVNYLDGLAEILPPAVARYGSDLAWQIVEAVQKGETFFKEGG